ncbi:MAG TPA: DUF2332 domain-containing protein, partial [Solirubrobacteraceae bacterium]
MRGERRRGPARERLLDQLRSQAYACRMLGSPLYARLLDRVVADVVAGGPAATVLAGHEDDGLESALALRLLGATHRLALEGQAPALAAHYPSTGGDGDGARAWAALRSLLAERGDKIRGALGRRVQTNEIGRSAALLGGFITVAAETGLPLRLLELGASAGLNLRWDAYRYEGEGRAWGPPDSPVRLGFAPPVDAPVTVVERAGCDLAPVDPTTEDGRHTLMSFVWPDQAARLARLEGALAVARGIPVVLHRAPAADWLAERLAAPAPGRATVVFHSVVMQYLDEAERTALDARFAAAGAAATDEAPLAHLAMEAADELANVRLTTWPGGR